VLKAVAAFARKNQY